MTSTRLSLSGLMVVIAILAAEFAAMRSGSQLWFSTIYSITLLVLLVATLAARFRRGGARAFWFGFALFGWAYFLMALGPWSGLEERGAHEVRKFDSDLLTTR